MSTTFQTADRGCGHSTNKAKEERLRRQVYAMDDAVAILEAGVAGGGLGLAERRHVHTILAGLDGDMAHEWQKTISFINAESMLSAEATGSFLRYINNRAPCEHDKNHDKAKQERLKRTVYGSATSDTNDGGLVEDQCGNGLSRFRMVAPDPTPERERLADERIEAGDARISGGIVQRYCAADFIKPSN